jgi:hypothetical protein
MISFQEADKLYLKIRSNKWACRRNSGTELKKNKRSQGITEVSEQAETQTMVFFQE